jgi:hypothetical protein
VEAIQYLEPQHQLVVAVVEQTDLMVFLVVQVVAVVTVLVVLQLEELVTQEHIHHLKEIMALIMY